MPTEITGKIKLRPDPQSLVGHPLASHIGVVCSAWAEIEDELACLFFDTLRVEPAIGAAILGKVLSVFVRLDMIKTALDLRFPSHAVDPFVSLSNRARKAASKRNDIVHGVWAVHDDYPESLLRFDGLRDPQLRMFEYRRKDFLEIELCLVNLHVDLKLFAESLAASPRLTSEETQERFWLLQAPPGGQPSD